MRIVWVTRSFLDYRVPVFSALDRRYNCDFRLLYSRDNAPDRVNAKVREQLGTRAEALTGEIRWPKPSVANVDDGGFSNTKTPRILIQPGLVKRIQAFRPDVIVTDGFFKWTTAALWLRATRGIPHVMCYERTAHTERNAQWCRVAYRRVAYRKGVMRWIDAMCCNGRLCGEYAQGLGFPADRMTYGHMVADVDGMKRAVECVSDGEVAALRMRLDLRGLVFLYVGRLIPLKGLDKLLQAWRIFSKQVHVDDAALLLVGDGPKRGELEEYCVTHGLTNVRFAGAVDYDALAPYYKAADIFTIPTLEDNWSLVVGEAMACGLPILCSKYNGCWPEYVTAANGWVFDPLDRDDTAAYLRRCFADKEDLVERGKNSQRLIANHTAEQAATAVLQACRIAVGS